MTNLRHLLIDLPGNTDARGKLAFAQQGDQIPFPVRRIFMLYAIPEASRRGGHAHRAQHQLLIMTGGACTVTVSDGVSEDEIRLDRADRALYVPPLRWIELGDFIAGSVCVVLASGLYDEGDYIRDVAEFHRLVEWR